MIKSIALNMVTYNEAHRIDETLDLIRPHVDEIVIVDQKSTDATWFNTWHWGVYRNDKDMHQIEDKHWGYCEPSRKLAAQNTNSDWILVLDADERISEEFAAEMRGLDDRGFRGVRLKRSLWVGGVHYWTGDYQYRFFQRDAVKFLDEIHTEPQPTVAKNKIYAPEYVGIWHHKTWVEQIRDEASYEQLIKNSDEPKVVKDRKLALNVYTQLLNSAGVTAEEADAMSVEEREAAGIGPTYHFAG
jgi:glycosyltransferase involved in cell wall biosynthesis